MKITLQIALQNIRKKRFKYIAVFTLLFLTAIAIFVGGVLLDSMKAGLRMTKERIGAEVIVVPDGYVSAVEDSLFKGKACTLTFDRKWETRMKQLPEVEKVSAQLYLATLSAASCCEGETQLIAIDWSSDFTITPWLKEQGITELQPDEIVVGSSALKKKGDIVTYYNKKFRVKAVLEHTGMGYDQSCFVSFEAARELIEDERNKALAQLKRQKDPISMVLLKVKTDVDAMTLKHNLERTYQEDDISIYSISSKLSALADQVQQFDVFGIIMNVFVILLAVISIFTIITITTYIRKNEIGSMLSVGIGKNRILSIFLLEYGIVALAAFLTAVAAASLVLFPFQMAIAQAVNLPYVKSSIGSFLALCGEILAIDIGIVLVSSVYSFTWIWRKDPAEMVKEVTG